MEKEDHLDKKIAISFEWSKSGVKASAESRTLSGIDRLFGSVADYGSAFIEAATDRRREKTLGERALINSAAQYGVQKMEINEPFAQRVFDKHFSKVVNAQKNKDEVVFEALDDLRNRPINDDEATAGREKLSDEFLDRFERYAEDASSDELRQRWGRILAGEIRKPGTFNRKVLRAVDELDSADALLFEKVASYHSNGVLIKPIMPQLEFIEVLRLVEAGLIVEPGMGGHNMSFSDLTFLDGSKLWGLQLGQQGVSVPFSLLNYKLDEEVIMNVDQRPAVPIYILTDIGKALCSIINSPSINLAREYYEKILPIFTQENISIHDIQVNSNKWMKAS